MDLAIRPDGGEVAYVTDVSGNFNAWREGASGGYARQLTTFRDHAVRRVAYSPDGARLLLSADRDGNEREQVYVMPAGGGVPRILATREGARHLLADDPWAPDGRTVALACNAENEANFDLVTIDTGTGVVRSWSREPLFHAACGWSADGRHLVGLVVRSSMHQDVVIADRETGDLVELTRGRTPARRQALGFSADDAALYLLTDEGREFMGLARLDLQAGHLEWIAAPDWDVDLARMSRDGRWIVYMVNEDAVHRLHVLDRNSGIERPVTPLPTGECRAIALSADGSRAALLHDAPTRPPEVLVYELGRGGMEQITHGMVGAIPPPDMVEPEITRFPSFDRKIPALLYRPRGTPPAAGFPALLWIHGGPEAQERPIYRPLLQYLVSRGFVVLAPNIRGSTGYGKTYQRLILRDFGGGDLRDLDAAARFLKSLAYVDGKRLAVAGGSYGGFATLSCATRLPDHWAAAVDICGPANLVTFAKSVPASWRRFMREWVGDPDDDREELLKRSPITYVDRLRCPTLVIQGAHDPRVVKAESDGMVERIRASGGSVDYVVFEDEGHGLLKVDNQIRANRTIAEFLERHLR